MDRVYLDHAATTPLDGRVLEAMLPFLKNEVGAGNPSSLHAPGTAAREAVEAAREHVAAMIVASPNEIVFTSGGTESDNLAVLGLAAAHPEKTHMVVSAIEHPAVRNAAEHLSTRAHHVDTIGVDADGIVSPLEAAQAVGPDTCLVAVMWANNEVGAVQDIEEMADTFAELEVPLHVDAVQAAGRLPMDVSRVPVATLAISSHKLYGPQGVGALYVRGGVRLEPAVFGGGQERGLRSGTHNVAGIVGFGEAARLSTEELEPRTAHERRMRDRIIAGATALPGVRLNGHPEARLSNNAHFRVEAVEAESLVVFMDALGYAIGSGSACASQTAGHKASPVLLAMGQGERDAFSAVRITVGKDTTEGEVEGFLEAFSTAVTQLRGLSPFGTASPPAISGQRSAIS